MLEDILKHFRRKLNVVVIGADGMLGKEVVKRFQKASLNPNSRINRCVGLSKKEHVLGKFSLVLVDMCQQKSVDVVVNCAAFTNTTKCEDKAYLKQSYDANVLGVEMLARTCAYYRVKLVHISTDYVYSQYSYKDKTWIETFPCNQYGMQKLLAEEKMKVAYAHWPEGQLICRMSWLYGDTQKDLFMHKTLAAAYNKLAWLVDHPEEREASISVVDDQFGAPQTAEEASWKVFNLVCADVYGTVNCWRKLTESRASFAQKILEIWTNEADDRLKDIHVKSCKSSDFPSAVQHPLFDKSAGIPNGYLSSNGNFCKLGSGWKFRRMILKAHDCIESVDPICIQYWISRNKDELQRHVFNMLSDEVKAKLDSLCCDEPVQDVTSENK